jgi:sulfatase maturation enzyme AslB (radical SAM superfamily)
MDKKGCYWADHGLVLYDDLSFRPCCRFPRTALPYGPTYQDGARAAFQHPLFQKVRDSLRAGHFPNGCQACEKEESRGVRSLRKLMQNETGQANQLESLELFVGSLCNMKCRMCEPRASSLWARELGEPTHLSPDLESLVSNMDLSGLKRLRLLGGETLLNKNFFKVAEILAPKVDLKQVEISFATNGSIGPTAEIQSVLNQFGIVQVDFSIDGIGQVGEYIRHGVPWSVIEDTLQSWFAVRDQFRPRVFYNVHTTIQATNYLYLPDILYFCALNKTSWSQRTLDFPQSLHVSNLPVVTRENIVLKYNSHPKREEILAYLNKRGRLDIWTYLTQSLVQLPQGDLGSLIDEWEKYDQRWGESWKESLPELKELLVLSHFDGKGVDPVRI